MIINNHGFAGSLRLSDIAKMPEQSAPENTVQPSFAPQPPKQSEEAEVNEGRWSGSPVITFEYQWQLNGIDIVGATSRTLLIIAGMAGGVLRCAVKAVNNFGLSMAYTIEVEVQI